MTWGMFSAAELGPLVHLHVGGNANVYLNLLRQHEIPSTQLSPIAFFMQDNTLINTLRN